MNTNPPLIVALLLVSGGCLLAQDGATPAPAPEPAEAPAQTEMQKWITTTDAQWLAALKRDVSDVHLTELEKLKQRYVALLQAAVTKASGAGDLDGAVTLRNEEKRFAGTNLLPEQDAATDVTTVKQIRAVVRAQIAKLDKETAIRTKALHAKYDQFLAQTQIQLTQRQRLDDALLVKAKRADVTAAWITPAIAILTEPSAPAITVPKTPVGPKPATGAAVPTNGGAGKPATKPGVLDASLAQRIKAALDARTFERLGPAAAKGEGHTDLPEAGALLVGFEYANGIWKGDPMVKSLKPLYLTPDGVVSGKARGKPDKAYKVVKAREGFAVSGLIVNPGLERLGGFQVIFAKIQARPIPFEKIETYKGEWIGGELKKGAVTLGGDGRLGIGIFGVSGADVGSIGLIVAP